MSAAIKGAAGAHFVAAELAQRGWMASPAWGDGPHTHVLAKRLHPPLVAAIEVSTCLLGQFQVGALAEQPAPAASNEWFMLVSLPVAGERPDFFLLPRDHMSALVYVNFRTWVAEAPEHRDAQSQMRAFASDVVSGYEEAWELLEHPASDAPWRLPDWIWAAAEEVGLPDGHPGLGPRSHA